MNIHKPDAATAFLMGALCALVFLLVSILVPNAPQTTKGTLIIIFLSLPPMAVGLIGLDAIRKNPIFPFEGYTGRDFKRLAKRWAMLILGGIVVVVLATLLRIAVDALCN